MYCKNQYIAVYRNSQGALDRLKLQVESGIIVLSAREPKYTVPGTDMKKEKKMA